jgi:hypothetical protein
MIDVTLSDDGTLDTVVQCECSECGEAWTERFSETSRHDNGEITDAAWEQIVLDCEDAHECKEN